MRAEGGEGGSVPMGKGAEKEGGSDDESRRGGGGQCADGEGG